MSATSKNRKFLLSQSAFKLKQPSTCTPARARSPRKIGCYLELSKKGNESDTSLIMRHLLTGTDEDDGQPALARAS